MPFLCKNDITLVRLFLRHQVSTQNLRHLNLCRLYFNSIFLSDIATADGRHLEQWVLNRNYLDVCTSSYKLPREQPCRDDWRLWDEFWGTWLGRQHILPKPHGQWIAPSHQQWGEFYNDSMDTLFWKHTKGWTSFEASSFGRITRGNKRYSPASFEPVIPTL